MEPAGPAYVVIGATGGIGRAVTARLASKGARLTLAARTADALGSLAAEVGGVAEAVDATSFDAVQELVESSVQRYGAIDGIVNCVGSILLKPAHLTRPEEWRRTLALNLDTAFAAVRAGSKAMMRSGGSIVLISSAAARTGLVNHDAVAAAKAGVEGLARSAAATYAKNQVRVNVVAPGLVDTPLSARITGSPASLEASKSMHPLGRIGRPEDVASAIVWLLDADQSFVTGQVIGVDGGLGDLRGR